MGIRAVFNEVKTIVQAQDSGVEFLLTAESQQFQGTPPKVVWELPLIGQEEYSRRQVGPGTSPSRQALGRVLWGRRTTCNLHIWMAAGGTDSDGYEYPDDNEDPNSGDTWLVQRVIQAIQQVCAGQYELGAGGWADRTMARLGFVYVLPVTLYLGVFDTESPAQVATPTTFPITGGYSS